MREAPLQHRPLASTAQRCAAAARPACFPRLAAARVFSSFSAKASACRPCQCRSTGFWGFCGAAVGRKLPKLPGQHVARRIPTRSARLWTPSPFVPRLHGCFRHSQEHPPSCPLPALQSQRQEPQTACGFHAQTALTGIVSTSATRVRRRLRVSGHLEKEHNPRVGAVARAFRRGCQPCRRRLHFPGGFFTDPSWCRPLRHA